MGTTTRISLADYLDYVAPEGFDDELIEGEIILSPAPKVIHEDICRTLFRMLEDAVDNTEFVVWTGMSMALETYESMPRPDVFVIDRKRWITAREDDTYPVGSPQLAIEVFSPSNRPGLMRKKVSLYLDAGSVAVWVIYPKRQTVIVHDAESEREYRIGEEIKLPAPLPEIAFPVSDIFQQR